MSTYRTITWLLLLVLLGTGSAQGAQERPNILILMAEDMSSRVAAFGDSAASTPNIDQLAASGVRFPNTFTTAGVCAPSRAAHITGMHQVSIGAQHMRSSSYPDGPYLAVPPPQVKAYPELLRRAGYYTLTNHKLDYQFSTYAAESGPFTIWNYEGPEPDWNLRAEGQPFFALINFGMTHESRMFPGNVVEQHKKGWKQVTDPADVSVPPYYPDTPLIRQDIAQQYDNVHEMDRMVGVWLDRLAADGLADNTIVIWTTDHGDGLPRSKREIYDSGIKVPMVVHWPDGFAPPGIVNGDEDTRLVSFIDFAPSVLNWAGAEVPAWMQGRPVLSDPEEVREYIFASKDRLDEVPFRERAVRDRQYKYLLNYRPGEPGGKPLAYREQLNSMQELHKWFDSGRMNKQQAFWFEPRPREELYNVVDDPFEVNNLAQNPAHAEVLERMRQAYSRWRDRVPDLSDEPESEMAQRFWPGGEQPVTEPPVISVEGQHVSLECPTEGASIGYRLDGRNWQVYSGPFEMTEGAAVEAKAVRYGWKESDVVSAADEAADLQSVALDHPALRFRGVHFVDVDRESVRFSRFAPELLELDKPQLGFNPAKARNTTGAVIAFRSDSPLVRLSFQPLEGLNRGSQFGVFADGQFADSYRFGREEQMLVFELANTGAGPVDWEISLPSFSNVELSALEISASSDLEAPSAPKQKTFVALGDSITHGTGQGSASYLTWPFLLSQKLDYELFNLAVGGSGVSIAQAQTLADFEPVELVTILFGYNDWNGEGNTEEEFKNEYRQMLSEVRAAQPGAMVFCISPLVTRREVSKSSGLAIGGFRDAVRELALEWRQADTRVHFIDGTEVSSFDNLQPEGSPDVVHLSIEGAALLAEALYPVISKYSP